MSLPFAIVPLIFGTESPVDPGLDLPAEQSPVFHRIAEDLLVGYAFDKPDMYEVVLHRHLADLGSADEVFALAVATLRERAAAELVVQGAGGRYRVILEGASRDLTASLVLTPDVFRSQMQFSGDPVIGLGSRIWMHLIDSADAEGIEGLRGLTAALHDEGDAKPINKWLYRLAADNTLARV